MGIERSVQLGVTRAFEIKIYNPDTGVQIAADAVPTLTFTKPDATTSGPFTSSLVSGTIGTYRATVTLAQGDPEGEWVGEWSYNISGNSFKPRFTLHAHKIAAPTETQ